MDLLILDRVDFRVKKITRDRQGHYIMIKGSVHQEDIAVLNVYASCKRIAKYMKKILIKLKGEIDKITITVGDFNTVPSTTERTIRQKISKVIKEFMNITNQQDLSNTYRTFHPKVAEYTFFLSAHRKYVI